MQTTHMQALLARLRAKSATAGATSTVAAIDNVVAKIKQEAPVEVDTSNLGTTEEEVTETVEAILDATAPTISDNKQPGVSRDVQLNEEQQLFLNTVISGADCNLIGAAGTGKTTTMRKVTRALIDGGHLPKLQTNTKWLKAETPGMVILSFTNKAVNNIRHAVVDELKTNTITVHKLLQFEPVFYEVADPANPGSFKKTMRFEPSYTRHNPLPSSIRVVAFEESSMIGLDLYQQLVDAMPHPHQEIFLGDIQQLPPVFGSAILGFKLNELITVELTKIYRQAANSPIIDLAWALLSGDASKFSSRSITAEELHPVTKKKVNRRRIPALDAFSRKTENGEVFFQPWQKKLGEDDAMGALVAQLRNWEHTGYYNPNEDIILCPFNKNFGTTEMNKYIAQFLGKKRKAVVHHVRAGFNDYFLAVGDRVLYNKEDAFITGIRRNGEYFGKAVVPPSEHLDRWGHYVEKLTAAEEYLHKQDTENLSDEALDKLMESAASEDTTERVTQASHVVELRLAYGGDDDNIYALSSASEINSLLGGYAITVHKAQGSEFGKVFFVMHHSHATMNQRELLYTAVTRAKNSLHIICEAETFYKGVQSQKIIGNTLAQKAALFKGKALAAGDTVPTSSNRVGGLLPVLRDYERYFPKQKEVAPVSTENYTTRNTPVEEPAQKVEVEAAKSSVDKRAELLAKLAAIRAKK